ICPAGQVVVGFEGKTFMDTMSAGTYMMSLSVHCAPLNITGLPGAPAISLGATMVLQPIGSQTSDFGVPIPPTDCLPGQIAVASRGQAATVVDAFGLGCAKPSISCAPADAE